MSNDKPTIEKVSRQLTALQDEVRLIRQQSLTIAQPPLAPAPTPASSSELARMRVSLRRARNAFRRLGHGSIALSGFTFVAFLAALFDGKLTFLTGFVTITAALFLGIVGYLFYLQADSVDLEGSDET